jgi:hypothetical protein
MKLSKSNTETSTTESKPVPLEEQARDFAEKHASDSSNRMRDTIRKTVRRASVIAAIVLGVSMPHQISFLISLCADWLHFGSWQQWTESIGMIMIAAAVPVVSDLLIVSCIEQISTAAASMSTKWRALGVIVLPLSVSGYVNFAAPGPILVKLLAAFLVSCILLSEILKFAKPDFRKFGQVITDTLAQVTPATVEPERRRARNRKERIIHLLSDDPAAKAVDIAKKANVSVNYVHAIRRDRRDTAVTS